MVSAGWDAEAVASLRPAVKRRIGRLGYALRLGLHLPLHPPTVEFFSPDSLFTPI